MAVLKETPHHARVGELPVPELEGWDYFEDGEALVWKVRNATTAEIFRAREAPERQARLLNTALKLFEDGEPDPEDLRRLFKIDAESVPVDVSRRIDLLCMASVHPVIGSDNRQKIVELSETHPDIFVKLTNLIDLLSGKGAVRGKPKRSGKGRTSETQ